MGCCASKQTAGQVVTAQPLQPKLKQTQNTAKNVPMNQAILKASHNNAGERPRSPNSSIASARRERSTLNNVGFLSENDERLLEVLRDPISTHFFRQFYVTHVDTHLLPIHYLNFWYDAEDYVQFQRSAYRNERAQSIYEHYIQHGCKRQVYLPSALWEEVIRRLEDPEGAPDDLFVNAQLHVTQLISVEVYSRYAAAANQDMLNVVSALQKSEAKRIEKVNNEFQSQETQDRLQQLLADTTAAHVFREFLGDRPSVNFLLFYLEVDQEYSTLPAGKFIRSKAQKMYDKYIKHGAKLQVSFPAALKMVIMEMLHSPTPSMFHGCKAFALEHLFKHEYQSFLVSAQYNNYQNKKKAADSVGKAVQRLTNDHNELENIIQERMGKIPQLVEPLSSVLRSNSNLANYFKKFLTRINCLSLLMLWQEIEDFKKAPSRANANPEYVGHRARRIYAKHLKIGARLYVDLDPELRDRVKENLSEPDSAIFTEVQLQIEARMERELYTRFYHSSEYQQYTEDRQRVDPGVDSPKSPLVFALDEVLSDETGFRLFKTFLQKMFNPEPLIFWSDVEDFKRLPKSQFLNQRARKIVDKYIKRDARLAINIPDSYRDEIMSKLEDPTPLLFQKAQKYVLDRLDEEEYADFIQTEDYKAYVREISKNKAKPPRRHSTFMGRIATNPQSVKLDSLLQVLDYPITRRMFKEFATFSQSAENYFFYEAVEEFKYIPGAQFLALQARKIFDKYIRAGSRLEVNIPYKTKATIEADLASHEISPLIFNQARDDIVRLMESSIFPLFVATEGFKQLKQELMTEGALTGAGGDRAKRIC